MIKIDIKESIPRLWALLGLGLLLLFLSACAGDESAADTGDQLAETGSPTAEAMVSLPETAEPTVTVSPTWTPMPQDEEDLPEPTVPAPPTNTPIPTSTVSLPTDTPEPTPTNTAEPTATLSPTNTPAPEPTLPPAQAATSPPEAPPTIPPEPVLGANLLPNGSFEEGHYNQNGVPELQLPNGWRLEWVEGPTGFGSEKWDVYVRPEARVLSTAFLPPEEHGLYIYNGQHTVKIFKGQGAVDFRLLTEVTLEPGTYIIEAKMFADVVEKWEDRQKVWPADPTAAEFRFLVGDGGTNWTRQNFGQINVHNWTFTVDRLQTMTVGIGLRGKYAIANNGWFIDDLSLRRIE